MAGTVRSGNELARQLTNRPNKPNKAETLKFGSGLRLKIAKGRNLIPPKKKPEKWEYYDPIKSGNPLLEIEKGDLDKQISPHFTVKEFVRIDPKDLKYVKGGTYWTIQSGDNVEYYRKYARIDRKLVALVESIRNDSGVIMVVNEGFRPYLENKRMYDDRGGDKAYRSRHISGQALDFEYTDKRILKSALFLMRNSGGIGLYSGKNALHIDCRRSKRRWTREQWDRRKEWPKERWLLESDIDEIKARISAWRSRR